jgi:hypothetical protein
MASKQQNRSAIKRITKRTSKPRLTVNVSAGLKRRIKIAAAARHVPISSYVAGVLERAVSSTEGHFKMGNGRITDEMIKRADALRAEQATPFPDDSADIIREIRAQRTAEQ